MDALTERPPEASASWIKAFAMIPVRSRHEADLFRERVRQLADERAVNNKGQSLLWQAARRAARAGSTRSVARRISGRAGGFDALGRPSNFMRL